MDSALMARLDSIDARLAAIERSLAGGATGTAASAVGGIPAADAAGTATPGAQPVARPLSVTEYVLAKRPADDNQRALVLAGYLEAHRQQPDFTVDELRQAFADARLKAPANVSDKIARLAKKGWAMQAGERDSLKAWRLTMTGMQLLEQGFGKE